jgi:hypothetical protein
VTTLIFTVETFVKGRDPSQLAVAIRVTRLVSMCDSLFKDLFLKEQISFVPSKTPD